MLHRITSSYFSVFSIFLATYYIPRANNTTIDGYWPDLMNQWPSNSYFEKNQFRFKSKGSSTTSAWEHVWFRMGATKRVCGVFLSPPSRPIVSSLFLFPSKFCVNCSGPIVDFATRTSVKTFANEASVRFYCYHEGSKSQMRLFNETITRDVSYFISSLTINIELGGFELTQLYWMSFTRIHEWLVSPVCYWE